MGAGIQSYRLDCRDIHSQSNFCHDWGPTRKHGDGHDTIHHRDLIPCRRTHPVYLKEFILLIYLSLMPIPCAPIMGAWPKTTSNNRALTPVHNKILNESCAIVWVMALASIPCPINYLASYLFPDKHLCLLRQKLGILTHCPLIQRSS